MKIKILILMILIGVPDLTGLLDYQRNIAFNFLALFVGLVKMLFQKEKLLDLLLELYKNLY